MANFEVGDEVVCISNKAENGSVDCFHLVTGQKYVVRGFEICGCGAQHITLVENYSPTMCRKCFTVCAGFRSWRFIKLDGLKEDTTEKQEWETY